MSARRVGITRASAGRPVPGEWVVMKDGSRFMGAEGWQDAAELCWVSADGIATISPRVGQTLRVRIDELERAK